MKKLKIIFVGDTLVFNLLEDSLSNVFKEKYSVNTIEETLRKFLKKLYNDEGFNKISNALVKAIKNMEKEAYKIMIIDSETRVWEKKMSASEYNQIKSCGDGSSNFQRQLKIIYSDEYLIFRFTENNENTFFKEKFVNDSLESILKTYLKDLYKSNVDKISNAFIKIVKKLKFHKYRIITIDSNKKWLKRQNEFEFNQIKIQSEQSKIKTKQIKKDERDEKLEITKDILKELEKHLVTNPNDAKAHNNLAIAYSELGRYDDAIDEFREALLIEPEIADYYFNLALNYHKKGNFDLAILEYKEAITLKPDFLEAYNKLAEIYFQQNKYHDAMYTYQQVILIDPLFIDAYIQLADICMKIEYVEDAIIILQDAFLINPTNEKIIQRLIDAHLRKKEIDAIEENNIGIAYAERGKMEQAISKFKKSIELNPNDVEVHYNLAYAYYKKGETDKAIEKLNETLKIDSNFAEAHNTLASIYKEQGKRELYEKEFQIYSNLLRGQNKDKQDVEINDIIEKNC